MAETCSMASASTPYLPMAGAAGNNSLSTQEVDPGAPAAYEDTGRRGLHRGDTQQGRLVCTPSSPCCVDRPEAIGPRVHDEIMERSGREVERTWRGR